MEVDGYVSYLGEIKDMAKELAKVDCFVLPPITMKVRQKFNRGSLCGAAINRNLLERL